MIFASALVLDREPLQWAHVPAALMEWVQAAGAFAALGLFFWMLLRRVQREQMRERSTRLGPLLVGAMLLAWAGDVFLLLAWLGVHLLGLSFMADWLPRGGIVLIPEAGIPWKTEDRIGDIVFTISGVLALAVVLAPLVVDAATRWRWGRIWAMARLSLKEAIRNRAVLVFGAMALVFLFADWFVPYRAEDQVRNYVRVVYWSMIPLFLLTASLLGSFSIPNDVKSQSIQTIVTKPIEKFEVVLGRFLGYGILLTVGLAAMACLSLLYVVQGVNENAQQESYKARVPVFGALSFHGTKRNDRGDSVGREWDYRSYIMGSKTLQKDAPIQYALWKFAEVPAHLGGSTEPVRFEYTFDIFRLSKGEEGKGIPCTFTFADGNLSVPEAMAVATEIGREYKAIEKDAQRERERTLKTGTAAEKVGAAETFKRRTEEAKLELMKRHRLFQRSGIPVVDYHTLALEVPPEFFKALLDGYKGAPGPDGKPAPVMQVIVNVDRLDESQMLGVAQRDLYLLAAEKPFWQNFLKGIVGMWCTFILVLGVGIALSTYLSGVITWFCTMFLFCAGLFTDYLYQIAMGRLYGGGPSEAMVRLVGNRPIGAPIDASPAFSLIKGADAFFSWWVRGFLSLVPDVNRYDLHSYVANGFDIAWSQVILVDNILPLIGYLLPWGVLAYYLMKYREIANPS